MVQRSDKKIFIIFVSLCLTIFILLFNFHSLLFNDHFIDSIIEKNSISEAKEPTKELISFFQGDESIPEVFDDKKESDHLYDVKKVINYSSILLFFSFLVCFISFFFIKVNLKKIFLLSFVFFIVLIIFSLLLPFDILFYNFHRLFFVENSWVFPASSTLIAFYPSSFFFDFFVNLFICSFVCYIPFIIHVFRKQ